MMRKRKIFAFTITTVLDLVYVWGLLRFCSPGVSIRQKKPRPLAGATDDAKPGGALRSLIHLQSTQGEERTCCPSAPRSSSHELLVYRRSDVSGDEMMGLV